MPTANPVPNESIADRVAHLRHKAAHSVLNQETGQLLEYHQLLKNPKFKEIWTRSAADEFGRLAQGIGGRIKGTDTIRCIHKREIPTDRLKDITYIKFVCNVWTEKKDPGNLINYPEMLVPRQPTCCSSKYFWTVSYRRKEPSLQVQISPTFTSWLHWKDPNTQR